MSAHEIQQNVQRKVEANQVENLLWKSKQISTELYIHLLSWKIFGGNIFWVTVSKISNVCTMQSVHMEGQELLFFKFNFLFLRFSLIFT